MSGKVLEVLVPEGAKVTEATEGKVGFYKFDKIKMNVELEINKKYQNSGKHIYSNFHI